MIVLEIYGKREGLDRVMRVDRLVNPEDIGTYVLIGVCVRRYVVEILHTIKDFDGIKKISISQFPSTYDREAVSKIARRSGYVVNEKEGVLTLMVSER